MDEIRMVAIDHIVLNVGDIDRSLNFYSKTLGMPVERVDAWRKGEVAFPSVRVSDETIVDLVAGERPAAGDPLNLNHFCLVVDGDLEDVSQKLTQAGVEIEEGPKWRTGARGRGYSIYIRDPDGNRIELRAYPPEAAGRTTS